MRKAEASKTKRRGSSRSLVDERVLVLAPVGRDAALACEVLGEAGFVCLVVADAKELRRRLRQLLKRGAPNLPTDSLAWSA